MVESLNYLRGRDKMVSEFKFFHGISKKGARRLRAVWDLDGFIERRVDAEAELIRVMSEEISRSIDEDIIERLTRKINGGDNFNYLDWWMNIGDNRA